MKPTKNFDLLIIGGGIAGMTAAVYAARANRSCVILEEATTGGLANSTYILANFPSYIEVHGMELMEKVREQVDNLGVEVEEISTIIKADLHSQTKQIETNEHVYLAKSVIIATGRKPIPLNIPTQAHQIHYCAICDGAPYKNKNVLVVGGGNSAFDESLYLLQLGIKHLTIIEQQDRFFAAQLTQEELLAKNNVAAKKRTQIKDVIVEKGKLVAALLENLDTGKPEKLAIDGIFAFLGQTPNSSMFTDCIKLDANGYIITNARMETDVPGVFAAGDIIVKEFRQLTTAAADGTIAGLMADRYLRSV